MVREIKDGMKAYEVWEVINDILDSVHLAADDKVYMEVLDYVTNTYGE